MNRQQTIDFCRRNTSRRNNVLYWAQEFAPNAYHEWNKSNKWNGFEYHFGQFMILHDKNAYPLTVQEMFEIREKQLNALLEK